MRPIALLLAFSLLAAPARAQLTAEPWLEPAAPPAALVEPAAAPAPRQAGWLEGLALTILGAAVSAAAAVAVGSALQHR